MFILLISANRKYLAAKPIHQFLNFPGRDLAIIATPASTVPDIIEECGTFGIKGIIIISAGFKEAGASGKILEEKIREI